MIFGQSPIIDEVSIASIYVLMNISKMRFNETSIKNPCRKNKNIVILNGPRHHFYIYIYIYDNLAPRDEYLLKS